MKLDLIFKNYAPHALVALACPYVNLARLQITSIVQCAPHDPACVYAESKSVVTISIA